MTKRQNWQLTLSCHLLGVLQNLLHGLHKVGLQLLSGDEVVPEVLENVPQGVDGPHAVPEGGVVHAHDEPLAKVGKDDGLGEKVPVGAAVAEDLADAKLLVKEPPEPVLADNVGVKAGPLLGRQEALGHGQVGAEVPHPRPEAAVEAAVGAVGRGDVAPLRGSHRAGHGAVRVHEVAPRLLGRQARVEGGGAEAAAAVHLERPEHLVPHQVLEGPSRDCLEHGPGHGEAADRVQELAVLSLGLLPEEGPGHLDPLRRPVGLVAPVGQVEGLILAGAAAHVCIV